MKKNTISSLFRSVLCLLCILITPVAMTNEASTAFLKFEQNDTNYLQGSWNVQYADLLRLIKFDNNGDNKIRWKEVINQRNKINLLLQRSLLIYSNQELCKINMRRLNNSKSVFGQTLSISFTVSCNDDEIATNMIYTFMSDIDPLHRCLVEIHQDNSGRDSKIQRGVFSYNNNSILIQPNRQMDSFTNQLVYGAKHILRGWDHLAFLLLLILSTTTSKRPKAGYHVSIKRLFGYITLFTVAHSATLVLSALGYASLPSRITESIIALSVAWTAWVVIREYAPPPYWLVFFFGLIHGLGFASIPMQWEQSSNNKLMLFGFNIGIELIQLLCVIIIIGMIKVFSLSNAIYPTARIIAYSILGISTIWITERTLEISLIPPLLL